MSTLQKTTTARPGPADRDALRRTAAIVGWLFIVTYVTSIAAKVAFYPPLFEGDYVTSAGQDTRVLWGTVSEALLIVANIGTATYLWPVLKRQHEALAMSFIGARVMESVFIGVGILNVLTIVSLRQSHAGDASAADLTVAGEAFVRMQEWTFGLGPSLTVGVGNGIILGYLMFRSGLVPRTLAAFGLVGGPLLVLSGTAAMLGVIELDGTLQLASALPEFIWELALGIYLIVKGFRPSPITTGTGGPR